MHLEAQMTDLIHVDLPLPEVPIGNIKLDADQNPNIMMQYGVMGIPTLMLFKGGQIKERLTGFQPKDKLAAKVTPHV